MWSHLTQVRRWHPRHWKVDQQPASIQTVWIHCDDHFRRDYGPRRSQKKTFGRKNSRILLLKLASSLFSFLSNKRLRKLATHFIPRLMGYWELWHTLPPCLKLSKFRFKGTPRFDQILVVRMLLSKTAVAADPMSCFVARLSQGFDCWAWTVNGMPCSLISHMSLDLKRETKPK